MFRSETASTPDLFRAWIAAGAVLLVLAYLALAQPTGVYERALLLMAVGAVSVAVAYPFLARPVVGLVALAPAALAPAISVGPHTGTDVAFFMAPGLLASWIAVRAVDSSDHKFLFPSSFRPALGLCFVGLISLAAGQHAWFAADPAPLMAQVAGLGVWVFSIGVFVIAAHEFRSIRWLKRSVFSIILVGAAYLAIAALNSVGLDGFGFMEDHALGSMFWTWLVAMALSQALFNRNLFLWQRFASMTVAGGALFLTIVLWSDWASGWLPALLAASVVTLARFPKTTLVAGVLGAALFAVNADQTLGWIWSPDQIYSSRTRIAAAQTLYQIAQESPIIGFGPANYYHYTRLFPILGWYVRFSSHNNYFDLVLQGGLCGFACLAWLWWELALAGIVAVCKSVDHFSRAYAWGAVAGLIGTVVSGFLGDWFLPFVYNVGLAGFGSSILAWVFLGGLVAVSVRAPELQRAGGPR